MCSSSSQLLNFLWIGHCQTSSLGAPLQPELSETNLSLGELQQVLEDEELALKLQEEEEKLFGRVTDPRI